MIKIDMAKKIARAREEKGLSKRELSRMANISDTELARIESGEREIPNPKTLRKISKYIGINYNDLMYAAGLGFQVSPLNPFLKKYYSNLKGEELEEALVNTLGSIENWEALVKSLKSRLEDNTLLDEEKEMIQQTIEDTEYQINSAKEIVKLIESQKIKLEKKGERKNERKIFSTNR